MSVARTIRRDLGAHFAVSRNLGESRALKCRRAFWASVYLAKALRIAIASVRREALGSKVIYKGKPGYISNWSGSRFPTVAGECGYHVAVDRAHLKSVVNFRELKHRFDSGFSFYMGNWHGIDVNRRLYRKAT